MKESIIEKILGERLKKDLDISPFLTIKAGARLPYVFIAETFSDWLKIAEILKMGIRVFVIGGGSNLVIKEGRDDVLYVINRYAKKQKMKENKEEVFLRVSSGYPISRLVKETVLKGWEGLEYHWGLPGTVGGAVYMNSKWTKPISYVGDNVVEALLLTPKGELKEVDKKYFKFGYDYSILQKTNEILVEVVFRFKKGDNKVIYERAMQAYNYRRRTQPMGIFTSGCFFKNIDEKTKERLNLPTTSAGYLIDKAGLKGFRIGNFEVSTVHANFIVNKGKGKTEDLITLVEYVRKKVKEKFGVNLELEVVIF